jgi:hypothetical protein
LGSESDESLLEETWRFLRFFFLRLPPPPDSDELLSESEVLLELLLLVLLDQERFRFLIFSDFSLSLSASQNVNLFKLEMTPG